MCINSQMVQQMSNVHISSPAGQPPASQQQTPGWPPQPSSNSMVGYKIVCLFGDKVVISSCFLSFQVCWAPNTTARVSKFMVLPTKSLKLLAKLATKISS